MSTRSARYGTLDLHTPKGRMLSGVDRDAGAFLESAQIFNTRQQQAVFELVASLKRFGLWSKMAAIYPFVGGTASAHKFNLKDPRDVDAAYRLTFSGGWTHSETGALPNGTNAYADTFWNENTRSLQATGHLSYYSRTNSDALRCDIGLVSSTSDTSLFSKYNNVFYPRIQATNNGVANTVDSLGYFISNRITADQIRSWRNNILTTLTSNMSGVLINGNVYICAMNGQPANVGIVYYSNRECAFASIGRGFTDAEANQLFNTVQIFQRRLGRAV